jgi:hypothetical protein
MPHAERRPEVRAAVEELANALDADDFDAVRARLAPDCVYTIGDQRHVGPDAITASYRDGSELARRLFDEVIFGHDIVAVGRAGEVEVLFSDDLRAGDEWFRHRSRQRIVVGVAGLVSHIDDIPIPGEHDALAAFMGRHGIER